MKGLAEIWYTQMPPCIVLAPLVPNVRVKGWNSGTSPMMNVRCSEWVYFQTNEKKAGEEK